jgi:hypothetical protein
LLNYINFPLGWTGGAQSNDCKAGGFGGGGSSYLMSAGAGGGFSGGGSSGGSSGGGGSFCNASLAVTCDKFSGANVQAAEGLVTIVPLE